MTGGVELTHRQEDKHKEMGTNTEAEGQTERKNDKHKDIWRRMNTDTRVGRQKQRERKTDTDAGGLRKRQ